jgi:hypothetical protein
MKQRSCDLVRPPKGDLEVPYVTEYSLFAAAFLTAYFYGDAAITWFLRRLKGK